MLISSDRGALDVSVVSKDSNIPQQDEGPFLSVLESWFVSPINPVTRGNLSLITVTNQFPMHRELVCDS